jgi:DNA-binding winged helix-turn-helix (wHTH) protein/Tol biopolymer transport system component
MLPAQTLQFIMPSYRFHRFEFDSRSGRLLKGGRKIRLQRKPQQLLGVLLEKAGESVNREELRASLWPDEAYLDFETGLNVAVKKLRDALCDSADEPVYIATEVGIGYRFIAHVEMVPEAPAIDFSPIADPLLGTQLGNGTVNGLRAEPTVTQVAAEVPSDQGTGAVSLSIAPPLSARPLPMAALLGTVAAVLILAPLGVVNWNRATAARPLRAAITLPPELKLMPAGEGLGIALSPDGTQVVFSAVGRENHAKLWLRQLDSLTPEAIKGTEDGMFPFWSPDGQNLGFFAGFELKRVNLVDHSVRNLCVVNTGRGGTWSKDGVILFSGDTRGPIYKISAEGGTPSPVTNLDESRYTTHRWPEFLPDGKHFVYLAANHDQSWTPGAIFLGTLQGGPAKFLGESDSNVVPVAGTLLSLSHGKLMSLPLDLESGVVGWRANIIAEGVGYDPGSWYGSFAATAATVVYRPRREKAESNTLTWFDREGNKLGQAGPPGLYQDVALAPDSRAIAATCGDPERNMCLIHGDGTVTQVSRGGITGGPVWAADSTFFSYYIHGGKTEFAIAIKPVDEQILGRMLLEGSENVGITSWHPDNRHALALRGLGNAEYQYCIFDLHTNQMKPYLPPESGPIDNARFSPDGNWVVLSKQSNGRGQIHIVSYPVPSLDYALTDLAGRGPIWRGDGREVYFLGPEDKLYAVAVNESGGRVSFSKLKMLFRPGIPAASLGINSFDVSRDGTRFLVNTVGPIEPSQFILNTNWQASGAR